MDADEILQHTANAGDRAVIDRLEGMHAPQAKGMTLRQRWRRTMFFQHVDVLPNMEFGYWEETLTGWHRQGLPPEVTDEASAYAYFGIENWETCWGIDVMGLRPGFTYEVLSEDADYRTYRADDGSVQRINRHGHKSIPQHLSFPISDRSSWESFRERLRPGPERLTATWPTLAAAYQDRTYPLAIWFGSLIGLPRNWIGFENIAIMVKEEPELLEEIVETLCQLICDSLGRVLPDVEFDFGVGWEDICFNGGPIVGPRFMQDVVRPRYQRITRLLARHGCHLAWTDCDGNILPILDSFAGGGINICFPVEVHGGSDPFAIRRRHPDQRLQGGFDKMKLRAGRAAIRAEVDRLTPLVRAGGFVPGVDHRVQADVSFDDYRYYLRLKLEVWGCGGIPHYDERLV